MIGSNAISSVRAVDYRSIATSMTRKTPGSTNPTGKSIGQTNTAARLKGARMEFRQGPRSGINIDAERAHGTPHVRSEESPGTERVGALASFQNNIRKLATDTLLGEGGATSKKTFKGSLSQLMENLEEVHTGAAARIKQVLMEYAKSLMESRGAPVKFDEPIKIFWRDHPGVVYANMPDTNQHVDLLA